jgi:hypothetical protein
MMECILKEALTELEIVTLYIRENILTKLKLLARMFQIAQIKSKKLLSIYGCFIFWGIYTFEKYLKYYFTD